MKLSELKQLDGGKYEKVVDALKAVVSDGKDLTTRETLSTLAGRLNSEAPEVAKLIDALLAKTKETDYKYMKF